MLSAEPHDARVAALRVGYKHQQRLPDCTCSSPSSPVMGREGSLSAAAAAAAAAWLRALTLAALWAASDRFLAELLLLLGVPLLGLGDLQQQHAVLSTPLACQASVPQGMGMHPRLCWEICCVQLSMFPR